MWGQMSAEPTRRPARHCAQTYINGEGGIVALSRIKVDTGEHCHPELLILANGAEHVNVCVTPKIILHILAIFFCKKHLAFIYSPKKLFVTRISQQCSQPRLPRAGAGG